MTDFFKAADPQYERIRVDRIVRTDTIVLENNEKIRLIGLKALPEPERPPQKRDEFGFVAKPDRPFLSLEERALRFVERLLKGQYVRLEFDVQKTDPQFHTTAYVFLAEDDTFVNEAILQNGYALLQIRPPNTRYAPRLRQAYREGHREQRGVHGE